MNRREFIKNVAAVAGLAPLVTNRAVGEFIKNEKNERNHEVKIKQIRNATLKIEYAGKTFLVDPWLTPKHGLGCFDDIPGNIHRAPDPVKNKIPMPIYDLPEKTEEILKDVDCYIITHIHPDHIDIGPDKTVGRFLNKETLILAQNENDAEVLKRSGFKNVSVMKETALNVGSVSIYKTPGKHGVITPCGEASGIIFKATDEKTLYIAGDTVWFEGVKNTLDKYKPDIIALNACAAELIGFGRLIMNDEDVETVSKISPDSKIIITHMDNVSHASITRFTMRSLLRKRDIKEYFMPEDGETLVF